MRLSQKTVRSIGWTFFYGKSLLLVSFFVIIGLFSIIQNREASRLASLFTLFPKYSD